MHLLCAVLSECIPNINAAFNFIVGLAEHIAVFPANIYVFLLAFSLTKQETFLLSFNVQIKNMLEFPILKDKKVTFSFAGNKCTLWNVDENGG